MRSIRLLLLLVALLGAAPAVAQWAQTHGPEGGMIYTLAADGSTVIAATRTAIYKHDGESWTLQAELPEPPNWVTLRNGVLLMAPRTQFNGADSLGILRSTDFGRTWTPTRFRGFGLAPIVAGSAIYGVVNDTLFRSTDDGASWSSVTRLPTFFSQAVLVNGNTMLASDLLTRDLFRSTDGGASWTQLDPSSGLPTATSTGKIVVVNGTFYSAATGGVYHSTDNGATWQTVNTGLPLDNGGATQLLTFGGALWTVIGGGLYSFDGGVWERVQSLDDTWFQFATNGQRLFLGSNAGVSQLSETGDRWESLNDGLLVNWVTEITEHGGAVYSNSAKGIFKSTDDGMNWSRVSDLTISQFATIGSTIFARTQDYSGTGIYRSTDNGGSWVEVNNGITETIYRMSTLTAHGTTLFCGFFETFGFHGNSHWESGGIFRSTDNGDSWVYTAGGLPNDGFSDAPINELVSNGNVVVAATIDGIYRTTDNGASWRKSHVGLPPSDSVFISEVVVNGREFYLATNLGGTGLVYRSTDDGATWSAVASGLPAGYLPMMLAVVKGNVVARGMIPGNMPAGYLYHTFDGTRWTDVTEKFPADLEVTTLAATGSYLLAGTNGASVWRAPLSTVASVEAETVRHASGFALGLVGSNPVNNATTVRVTAPAGSHARLSVTDGLGRTVAVLIDGHLEAGAHDVPFDATALPTGSYFVRLVAGGEVIANSLIVVR